MSSPDPHNVCDGCRQSLDRRRRAHVELGPIVHDDIWRRLAEPGEALCLMCMGQRAERRLGRLLTLADLRPCAWNLFGRPHSWFDMFLEFEAARDPANNLDEWHEQELRGDARR
jgi:hypothetical protein